MSAVLPAPVRDVFCNWELVRLIMPLGRENTRTKTFVHHCPETWAITRYVNGQLVGHIRLTNIEFYALGDLA